MLGARDSDLRETARAVRDLTAKGPSPTGTHLITGQGGLCVTVAHAALSPEGRRNRGAQVFGCEAKELGLCFAGGGAPREERALAEFLFGAVTTVAVAGGRGMGRTAGPETTSPGSRRDGGAPEWMLRLVRGPVSRTPDWLVVGIRPRGKDLGDFWVSGSCAWVDGPAFCHTFFEHNNKNHGIVLKILISCGFLWGL